MPEATILDQAQAPTTICSGSIFQASRFWCVTLSTELPKGVVNSSHGTTVLLGGTARIIPWGRFALPCVCRQPHAFQPLNLQSYISFIPTSQRLFRDTLSIYEKASCGSLRALCTVSDRLDCEDARTVVSRTYMIWKSKGCHGQLLLWSPM